MSRSPKIVRRETRVEPPLQAATANHSFQNLLSLSFSSAKNPIARSWVSDIFSAELNGIRYF